MKSAIVNWKTTVIGWSLAAAQIWAQGGFSHVKTNWPVLVVAAGTAVLGTLAKDSAAQ